MALGTHNGDEPGVHLFTRAGAASWAPPTDGDTILSGSGMFADSIDLEGQTLVVNGDPIRVFERSSDDVWTSSQLLSASSLGPVELSGDVIVVGSEQTPDPLRQRRKH